MVKKKFGKIRNTDITYCNMEYDAVIPECRNCIRNIRNYESLNMRLTVANLFLEVSDECPYYLEQKTNLGDRNV